MELNYKVINKQLNILFYLFIFCSISTYVVLLKFDEKLDDYCLYLFVFFILSKFSLLDFTNRFTSLYLKLKKENKLNKIKEIIENYEQLPKLVTSFYLNLLFLNVFFFSIFLYLFDKKVLVDGLLSCLLVLPFSITGGFMINFGFESLFLKDKKGDNNENINEK